MPKPLLPCQKCQAAQARATECLGLLTDTQARVVDLEAALFELALRIEQFRAGKLLHWPAALLPQCRVALGRGPDAPLDSPEQEAA